MKFRIDLKILFFLVLFYFTRQLNIYLLIMFFCFLHECSHLLVGLALGFKFQELELMPFGFSIKFRAFDYNHKFMKSNIVEFKKLFVIIAGPLLNLILAIVFSFVHFSFISQDLLVYSNLLIFIFNFIPICPLDGGRFLKSLLRLLFGNKFAIFLSNKITNFSAILLTFVSGFSIFYFRNIAILIVLFYIWDLVFKENKKFDLLKSFWEFN